MSSAGPCRVRESELLDLAGRQHAVVTRRQLMDAGLSPATINRWLRTGRLRKLHRGVYLLGPLTTPLTRVIAAVLACGPEAWGSHETAAGVLVLLPLPLPPVPVDVAMDVRFDRGHMSGIRPHRIAGLRPEDTTVVHGVPVTSVARTILDLAGVVRPRRLEQALAQAERRHRLHRDELRSMLDRCPGVRGSRTLRALLESSGAALTRSEAEERFLDLVRKGRLPQPATNVRVGGVEVDFFWPAERLAVEVDGFAFHGSRTAFEADRQRDLRLATRGVRVLRVTWNRLVHDREALLVELAQALLIARSQ
jgi:very-short-patch-repair endonuclease